MSSRVTLEKYNKIKSQVLHSKKSLSKIAFENKVSETTVRRIKKSRDFAEYKRLAKTRKPKGGVSVKRAGKAFKNLAKAGKSDIRKPNLNERHSIRVDSVETVEKVFYVPIYPEEIIELGERAEELEIKIRAEHDRNTALAAALMLLYVFFVILAFALSVFLKK